jgi:predicted GIY-YIG superfamily endonuclease
MPVAMRSSRRKRGSGSGLVYLVHFERPYHHARHYVGFTDDVERRMEEHRAGAGARLLAALVRAGVAFTVVFTWPGASRAFERKIHSYKKSWVLCPTCRGSTRYARAYAPRDPAARLAPPEDAAT